VTGGKWVRQLQQSLVDAGFDPGPPDGTFGETTEQAVLDFQGSWGLDVDAVVGPATWDALGVPDPEEEPTEPTDDTLKADWTALEGDARVRYVMALLVDRYGYPINGAAGIVDYLWAESAVLPNRIEGSSTEALMRARLRWRCHGFHSG
jgi:peptidoglycan hydrolase-like protein with peptidoglycan-binding domain